jgi:hypothetical protein
MARREVRFARAEAESRVRGPGGLDFGSSFFPKTDPTNVISVAMRQNEVLYRLVASARRNSLAFAASLDVPVSMTFPAGVVTR